MSLDPQGRSYYTFILIGRVYKPHLRQVLEKYPYLKENKGRRKNFEYIFETKIGVAYIDVGIGLRVQDRAQLVELGYPIWADLEKRPDEQYYTDGLYFELSIATPLEFIKDLIDLFDELAKEFPFEAVKIFDRVDYPFLEKGSPPIIDPIVKYSELWIEYQKAQERWNESSGIVTFFLLGDPITGKHPDEVGTPSIYYFKAGLYGYLPICVFLTPPTIELEVISENSHLQFELKGNPVRLALEEGFYQKIEALQLGQCQILQVDRQENRVVLGKENLKISLKLLVAATDKGYYYAAVTTLAKVTKTPQIETIEYHRHILDTLTNTQAEGQPQEILQCLIELATKLEWVITDGLEFEQAAPLELEISSLVSLSESVLRGKSELRTNPMVSTIE